MTETTEVLVIQPGHLRVVLVGTGLILCTVVLLGWAAAAIFAAGGTDFIPARIILVLWALGVVAIGIYLLLLLNTLALRIELGPERLKLRLPRMRGHLPLPGLIRAELPFESIASVQHRAEIFSSFGSPKVQHAFSLVTRDSGRLPLGFIVENAAFQYPFGRLADAIAARAACPKVERGPVHVGSILRAMIHGTPEWSGP
jgi:hypothetical protein